MKKIYFLLTILCLPFFLEAVTEHEKFWEEQSLKKNVKGLGFHADLAYSSYLIELHSSEMDSAIDYDILETTLGVSYAQNGWLVGTYGKFMLNELQSNMFVVTTQAPLNNRAKISKDEFALYVNYTFLENEIETWGLNSIYRYASVDASDAYTSFFNYVSYFKYQTDGLAFSLTYQRKFLKEGLLFGNIGVLYSHAKVNISEAINAQFQDSFIDDEVKALGFKVSLGYQYAYSKNLSLHLRTDAWKQNFNTLKVTSRVGDTLPNASLKEESYTTYLGIAWRF